MSDLKTLEELYNTQADVSVNVVWLRENAIKWIKNMKELIKSLKNEKSTTGVAIGVGETKTQSDLLFEDMDSSEITGAIKFIKGFFNITEEDLKN